VTNLYDSYCAATAEPSATAQHARWANPLFGEQAKGSEMNWNIVEGNWKQFTGAIKGRWGRLTDDPVDEIAGKSDELAGKVQETYGSARDKAEKTVTPFEDRSKK
jgi:uncharacterized protein YjbJ (UPF0337 family)